MAEQFTELSQELQDWIDEQHIFFVASAAPDGRVNVSPKGQDSLRIIDGNHLLWMNLTGSGNETAAHLQAQNRMTLMWCAFNGPPRILRIYGDAQVVHPRDPQWQRCTDLIPPSVGTRQYFEVSFDLVQTSCGYAVPMMDYVEDRTALTLWAEKRGPDGIADYWQEKNTVSMDGLPTGVLEHD